MILHLGAARASPNCNVTIRTDASTFAPSSTTTLQAHNKYVMLRFDDTFQDQWVNALPILQKYGFKATFAIIVGSVRNQSVTGLSNGWEEMGWREVWSLYNSGNEIGDHTMAHADLAYQSCCDLNYQIAYSKYMFAQHGMTYVPALILPYGDGFHNDTVTSFAYRAWFQHIYSDPGSPALSEYSNPDITTTWYDIDAGSGQSLFRFESVANRASSTNIVGFTFHHIDDHVGDTTYYVNYTNFLQDMAYLNNGGFTVILPSNLPVT
jgi:peptidoglycan/xylan/chitin deacetylase (PgdA/CDA1 family)